MSAHFLLIDDRGTVWDGASAQLRTSYGCTSRHEDFSTYVVKNLGFIAVHIYGRSCEIRFRPRIVKTAAFTGLKEWIRPRKFERIVTAHFTNDWIYGLHNSDQAALAKIDALASSNQRVQTSDYLMRALRKDQLPRSTPLHRALHTLIEDWPTLSQSVHRDSLRTVIEQSLQGRYTLVDALPGTQDLVFREIGHGFLSYNDEWVARTRGHLVEELEDAAYGRWAASGYRDALRLGTPTLCDVDAIMETSRLGRARIRYKRVVLPVRSVANGSWLLTSSILDPTIDLRVDLLQESA